jgi:hypothetical protein
MVVVTVAHVVVGTNPCTGIPEVTGGEKWIGITVDLGVVFICVKIKLWEVTCTSCNVAVGKTLDSPNVCKSS